MNSTLEPCDQAGRCTGYCGGPCPGEDIESSTTAVGACGICEIEVTVTITVTEDGVKWTSYSCEACGSTWAMADAGEIDLGVLTVDTGVRTPTGIGESYL